MAAGDLYFSSVSLTCSNHVAVPARFICTGCQRAWCGECAAARGAPHGVRFCSTCRGVLAEHREVAPPDDLSSLAARFVSGDALMTLGLLSLPGMLALGTGLIGYVLMFVYLAGVAGYAYETVDHIASRRPGLPFGAPVLDWIGMGQKVLRGGLVLAVAVGPALLAWRYHGSWPLIVGLLLVGLSLAPASWLAGFVTRHSINQVYPPALWEVVLRNPQAYLHLCGWFYVAGLVVIGITAWLSWLLAPSGLVQAIIVPLPITFGSVFIAGIFGRHLQHHAPDYGLQYH